MTAWWYWALFAAACAVLYAVARSMRTEWLRTRRLLHVASLRAARAGEDFWWQHSRLDALRFCMNATIRRAEWRRAASVGIPATGDSEASR